MMEIRRQEKDVIHAVFNDITPHIEALEYKSSATIPVPYILWNETKAILVAGNNLNKDINLQVKIPLEKTGFKSTNKALITDLWNGGEKLIDVKDLASFSFKIKKDKISGGGIAIYKIQPIP